MSTHLQSSGRGGAGNIIDSSKSPPLQPEDLQTPTLKTSKVTTGRGGTGNFASNLDPEEKRRRQDVEPYVATFPVPHNRDEKQARLRPHVYLVSSAA
jgi:hypothetical protein